MKFPTTPRDLLFLIFEELNVSAEFSGFMAGQLDFSGETLSDFSAGLLNCHDWGAEMIFRCTTENGVCSALLLLCTEVNTDFNVERFYNCRGLKKFLEKQLPGLRCAFVAPQRLVDKLAVSCDFDMIIPFEKIRDYFKYCGGRRGSFIVNVFEQTMSLFSGMTCE